MPTLEKSPDQAIHDVLFSVSLQLGYNTFNYLPANDAKYPFVYIGEVFMQSRRTKSHLFGDYQVTVHVYANDPKRDRKVVTDIMNQITHAYYRLESANDYQVIPKRHNAQVINENASGQDFVHGVLELDMTIN